jgi:hypothetical protein
MYKKRAEDVHAGHAFKPLPDDRMLVTAAAPPSWALERLSVVGGLHPLEGGGDQVPGEHISEKFLKLF